MSIPGAPLPGAKWQYVVQRALTGDILDRDAQIVRQTMSWALSKPGDATFLVPAGMYEEAAQDGDDLFASWSTIIIAVASGQVRWRGIVTEATPSIDGELTLECHTLSTVPHGIPWLGEPYYGAEVDPGTIMRKLWAHVQSFRNSNLGVVVVGSTGQKVGTFSTQNAADAATAYKGTQKDYLDAVDARKAAADDEAAARKVYSTRVAAVTAANKALAAAKRLRPKNQAAINTAQANVNAAIAARTAQDREVDRLAAITDAKAAIVKQRSDAKGKAADLKTAANKAKREDGGAFTLLPWELPDCGETIDTLTDDWGFDWVERSEWGDDRNGFNTTIEVLYPRAGTKRTDLVFSDSINLFAPIVSSDTGDEYANSVVGIGAGEGATSIRRERSTFDGNRIRRVKTVSAKDAKSAAALDKRIAPVAAAALKTIEFATVKVVDHPNARIGSWNIGDDIRIDATIPHLGSVKIWHRIIGYSIDNDAGTIATLTLKRSSSFTYGG